MMKDWVRLEFTDSSKKLCAEHYTNLPALRIARANYLYDFLINYTFCRLFAIWRLVVPHRAAPSLAQYCSQPDATGLHTL